MKKRSNIAERPYERFLSLGPESLTNAELLAIFLRTGTRGETATGLGRKILQIRDPDNTALSVLHNLDRQELLSIEGIGEVKAVKILCLAELAKRLASARGRGGPLYSSASSVANAYMERLRHEQTERAYLLCLDNKLSLLAEILLSIGTVNRTMLDPREVYLQALHKNAVHILLLHNHPSGDPTPSREDIACTRRIAQAGELLGIPLLDHLVIGDGAFVSMKERGILPQGGTL